MRGLSPYLFILTMEILSMLYYIEMNWEKKNLEESKSTGKDSYFTLNFLQTM